MPGRQDKQSTSDRRLAWRRLTYMLTFARGAARPVARIAGRIAWRVLEVPFALLLIFLEWGWRPLAALLAELGRLRLFARFEAWLLTLPPYPALAVFALPGLLVLPLKLAALWLIAHGHAAYAVLLFIGAKVVGTAIVARLFVLLQPKLMSIGWFRAIYQTVMPWKERIFARIRASWAWRYGRIVKERVARLSRRVFAERVKPLTARVLVAVRRMIGSSSTSK